MSLIAQNYLTERDFAEKGVGFAEAGSDDRKDISGERIFQCEVATPGVSIYAPDDMTAIILLEATRNLRWKTNLSEETSLSCPAGTVFVIPPCHDLAITWSGATSHIVVRIGEGALRGGWRSRIVDDSGVQPVNMVRFSSKQCLQIGQLIREHVQEPENDDESYIDSLYSVLISLISRSALVAQTAGGVQTGLSNYACRQIEQYLKANFRNAVSVSEMATLLGISSGHFATCFRESFGQTPHQYLMRLKLDEAERCLKETDMPISEISARLNFSSQSHLTTALRKYRHLTPGEIRRRGGRQRLRSVM